MIPQWRHRRRRRKSSSENDADHQNENDLSPLLHENEKPRSSCSRTTQNNRRQQIRFGVIIIVTVVITLSLGRSKLANTFRHMERYIDNSISDKFTRGMLFLPLRYLRVKWIDPLPIHERKFVMKYNSTFVLNLESDKERWAFFQRVNQKRMKDIQRIPSTRMHPELSAQIQGKGMGQKVIIFGNNTELKTQQLYFSKYPALKYLAKRDGMGTAACSLSHLRLLQDLLDQDASDYMFVFEDDIEILDSLLDDGVVMAPNNADVVLLSACSLGHVSVSWQQKRGIRRSATAAKDNTTLPANPIHNNNAIRVISGYSTWGYIITKRGARILLDEYTNERTEPIDVYIFKNANLKVYLPTSDWPVVAHGKVGIKSARRNNDN